MFLTRSASLCDADVHVLTVNLCIYGLLGSNFPHLHSRVAIFYPHGYAQKRLARPNIITAQHFLGHFGLSLFVLAYFLGGRSTGTFSSILWGDGVEKKAKINLPQRKPTSIFPNLNVLDRNNVGTAIFRSSCPNIITVQHIYVFNFFTAQHIYSYGIQRLRDRGFQNTLSDARINPTRDYLPSVHIQCSPVRYLMSFSHSTARVFSEQFVVFVVVFHTPTTPVG